jgi:hypothetical protein
MTKRPRPDLRPSWRDPNLSCIRDYRFSNGERRTDIDPDYERRYREMLMETSAHPNWRNDPTYNLQRKPK